ncbi:MAG: hypothetical protein RR998_06395 [Oscillospiraceae bacterium]
MDIAVSLMFVLLSFAVGFMAGRAAETKAAGAAWERGKGGEAAPAEAEHMQQELRGYFAQYNNFLNYDGTERGQKSIENRD